MNQPIRVLQIVTHMNRGGLETMLMNYYRKIDRSKIQFDFLTHRSYKCDYDNEITSLGGKIYHLPRLNPLSKNYLNELNNFFKKHKEYRIVHSHLDCMSTIPLKYAMKNGVSIRIAHSHNTNQEKNFKYIFKLISKREIPNYATDLFACGYEAGKWMYGNRKFKVLNNAIDAKKFQYNVKIENEVREELDLNHDFVIGHVGRFNEQKNHKFLIEVFYEIHKLKPNSKLVLVGIGELQEEIMKMVDRFGIKDSVLFLGLRNDIEKLMQAFDIFLFPSLFEGLPVTMIEAQAAGLRCVISDTVSNQCDITKNVISLSLKNDSVSWAKEIIKYGSSYKKQDTYRDIVKGGFDAKENVRLLEEFYLNEWKDNI